MSGYLLSSCGINSISIITKKNNMKKLLFVALIGASMVACNETATKTTTDSTTVKTDSTKVTVDTSKMAMDTSKKVADTASMKMSKDTAKKVK